MTATRVPPKGCSFVIGEKVRVKDWRTKDDEPLEGRIESFEERIGIAGVLLDCGGHKRSSYRDGWYPVANLETVPEAHQADCDCGAHS